MSTAADNIRTIAKTKQITEKLDKLTKELEKQDKTSIDSKRVVAYDAGALKDTSAGPASPTPIVDGAIDAAGDTITPTPTNGNQTPAIPTKETPITSPFNDAGGSYTEGTNTASGSSSTGSTDMSGNGKEGAQGGSKAYDQATKGENNAEINALKDAMADAGYTQSEIDDKVRELLNFEEGVHNITDVYNGLAGPNISYNPDAFGKYQQLNGIVGLDSVNQDIALMLRFDGQFPTPSLADAIADGQGEWIDPDTPPSNPSWVLGKRVIDNGNSTVYSSGDEWIEYVRSLYTGVFDDITLNNLSGSPPNSGSYSADSATAGGTLRTAGIFGCSVGVDDACPATNPGVSSWPFTGTYVLSKQESLFVANAFDATVPAAYQGTQSTVTVKTNDGDTLYVSPAINGGTLIYDSLGLKRGLYYDSNMALKAIVAPGDTQFYLPKR